MLSVVEFVVCVNEAQISKSIIFSKSFHSFARSLSSHFISCTLFPMIRAPAQCDYKEPLARPTKNGGTQTWNIRKAGSEVNFQCARQQLLPFEVFAKWIIIESLPKKVRVPHCPFVENSSNMVSFNRYYTQRKGLDLMNIL